MPILGGTMSALSFRSPVTNIPLVFECNYDIFE